MRHTLAVMRKELYLYFFSPVAWVAGAMHMLLTGWLFYNILVVYHEMCRRFAGVAEARERLNLAEMVNRPLVMNTAIVLLLLIPLIAMRLHAEERRSGTIDLLLTSPLSSGAIVRGKFLASLTLVAMLLAASLLHPLIMRALGPIEPGAVAAGFLGLLLLAAAFLALCNFISTLTDQPMVAAVLSLSALLLLWLLPLGARALEGPFSALLAQASPATHLHPFAKGVVDSRGVVYYLSFAGLFLFLARRSLESLRWRL